MRASRLGVKIPVREGNAVASTLGIAAPETDVRRTGVGTSPSVASERLGSPAERGKAGEAKTWRAWAPSDKRMNWCIVQLSCLIVSSRCVISEDQKLS